MKLEFHAHPYQRYKSENDNHTFTFLNISKSFPASDIDWNEGSSGKLWTYHLNYFDFLVDCDNGSGINLIQQYILYGERLIDGLEPYPTSLRIINWVKFSCIHQYQDESFLRFLRSDLARLNNRLEFHLLANHLLENYCSLFIGAAYFKDEELLRKATKGLVNQLRLQYFEDGMHYERSPMYHVVLLTRILDCYKVVESLKMSTSVTSDLMVELVDKLKYGIGKLIWFSTESILPEFNDTSNEETPIIDKLIQQFNNLGIYTVLNQDNYSSGFYRFDQFGLRLYANYGNISPSYQPGHAHADTFSIILFNQQKPIICDTGISTYEKNNRRAIERSTTSHNTLCVNDVNSSDVWGGFRLGSRARVRHLKYGDNKLSANHNGYKKIGVIHQREIKKTDKGFLVIDSVSGKKDYRVISSLHFHPHVRIQKIGNELILNETVSIKWTGVNSWKLEGYQFASGYNKLESSTKWVGDVSEESVIEISYLNNQ